MKTNKREKFENLIKNRNFFYHISMPRSGTNYVSSLIENITKRLRFDFEDEPFSKYVSNIDIEHLKQKEPIFFTTHECFNSEKIYSGCEFAFSDNEKKVFEIEDFRKVIVQIRDPIEVCYSLQNLGINFNMKRYNNFVNKWCFEYEENVRTYGNKFIILYDDLINNKYSLISELCEFLNIPYTDGEIKSILESIGDKKKFINSIKTNEKHLKNSHTLTESYSMNREKFIIQHQNFYDEISVENLKSHFKQNS